MWPDADVAAVRLSRLVDDLVAALGPAVAVERPESAYGLVHLRPTRSGALGVSWCDYATEITLFVAGGRWELDRTAADVAFLEDVVRSVVAGRVTEVAAGNRSGVTVTLADGGTVSAIGRDGWSGCLPLPFWTRWGRRVSYAPYVG